MQQVKANALLVNQSGRQTQCFECQQWGHKRTNCPNKANKKKTFSPPLPTLKESFQNQNKNQNKQNILEQLKNVKINYVSIKDEQEEQAQIYAALDPSGHNSQFTILETQGEYEGKHLIFLIDSQSSHSFLSLSIAKRLRVEEQPTGKKLRASLANGSSILADEQVLELSFQLGGNPTSQEFRILKMGKF